jgi:hypothetical protein
MNDEHDGNSFLDHMFNALGHLSRAQKKANAEAEATRANKQAGKGKPGKVKVRVSKASFDEAPRDPAACCTAKRE